MLRSPNRRQVLLGLAGVAASTAVIPRSGLAQATPAATPAAGLDYAFPEGVLPTIFGDIAIPEKVEKVVTLTDGALDAMITVGVQPVGATRSSNGESAAEYLLDQVSPDLQYIGGWGELDLEMLVALAPDVIISDRYLFEEDFNTLSAIAPTFGTLDIAVADDDVEGLQQWEYEQLAWAHIVGKGDEARAAIADARARAAGIAGSIGEHAGDSVVVFRPQVEFPVLMSHAWITGRVLSWCGLTGNEFTLELPPPHSGDTVSLEQLNVIDADWLLAATRDQEMSNALVGYGDMPLFQQLVAVQNGQVAEVDGALWSGSFGVQASLAMMDDIERIIVNGER